VSTHEEAQIERYSLFDRLLHWFVTLTFVYLLLSGLAIGYPRMAWLFDILGGGQTVRSMHPWMGAAFTLGIVVICSHGQDPCASSPSTGNGGATSAAMRAKDM